MAQIIGTTRSHSPCGADARTSK